MTQIDTSKQRPFGQGEKIEWPGGMASISVQGQFFAVNGVSTSVELIGQARQADGSLAHATVMKIIQQPGSYHMALSPGVYWFQASGPRDAVLSIETSLTHLEPVEKPLTRSERALGALEERVEALEADAAERRA